MSFEDWLSAASFYVLPDRYGLHSPHEFIAIACWGNDWVEEAAGALNAPGDDDAIEASKRLKAAVLEGDVLLAIGSDPGIATAALMVQLRAEKATLDAELAKPTGR